jgi:hypothetical protein
MRATKQEYELVITKLKSGTSESDDIRSSQLKLQVANLKDSEFKLQLELNK